MLDLLAQHTVKTKSTKSSENLEKLIFSFYENEFLGIIVEARSVKLLENGNFSLSSNKVREANSKFYGANEDATNAIKLLESIEPENIVTRFNKDKKQYKPAPFFAKYNSPVIKEQIRDYVESVLEQVLPIIKNYPLFLQGDNKNPTHNDLKYSEIPASVLFHYKKQEDESLHYFVTLKQEDQKINIFENGSKILITNGAWVITPSHLLHFSKFTDGKKLKPFLTKRFIPVAKTQIPLYMDKFIQPLLENHNIYTDCFAIRTNQTGIKPLIKLGVDLNNHICIALYFSYGDWTFPYFNNKRVNVNLTKDEDGEFVFTRITRSLAAEQQTLRELKELGLSYASNQYLQPTEYEPFHLWGINWINENYEHLTRLGYQVDITDTRFHKYYLGNVNVQVVTTKQKDWFDLYAIIKLDEYEIPFIKFRKNILQGINEYILPNGKIFILPNEWFEKFKSLSLHGEEEGQNLRLKNMHLGLLSEMEEYAAETDKTSLNWADEILSGKIPETKLPANFYGQLRDYQQHGFNWITHLQRSNVGPLLSDDMGLGKTIQAISVVWYNHEQSILNQKEKESEETKPISLIIAPKSLLYNWQKEVTLFSKKAKVAIYTGTGRKSLLTSLQNFDILISSYGTMRADVELFENLEFNTIILDESQAIKNPASLTARRINKLKSKFKLALTGTPIENSLLDLWSQMNFLNPGLLGSYQQFDKNYIKPIEKQASVKHTGDLRKLLNPLILRRTKSQVAKELPPKVEKIHYCEMSEQQETEYKAVLNQYRNELLKDINNPKAFAQNKLRILNSLTHLRQLALNPTLRNAQYEGDSGKDDEILRMLTRAIEGNHKVLIFSQFVTYLHVLENHLKELGITYAYLDGSMDTHARNEQVEYFQNNTNVKVFLLSLRAGNTGLNLTAADYVFLADPWWNPFTMKQAEDRAHRIGQDKTVFSYKFITKNTIEEKILLLQERKTNLALSIIPDETSILKDLTPDEIQELLND